MKLSGGLEFVAPPDHVWALINDPVSLSACIPGARDVRQIDERTFQGSVTAAVGPIEGDFSFTATLSRNDAAQELEVRLEGIDSVTRSRLESTITAVLTRATQSSGTGLAYQGTITVHGRLAILGEMILRATAGMMIAEVTRCLKAQLDHDVGEPAGGSDRLS